MFKLTLLTFILPISTTLSSNLTQDLDFRNIIVEFYPYPSILDVYNRRRYNSDDLIPFVSKVATKFMNIALDLHVSEFSHDPKTSYYLAGYAVAKYNCLKSTTRKIKLFLELFGSTSCDCKINQETLQTAANFADEINNLCNETAYTIMFRGGSIKCRSVMRECGPKLNLTDRYQWGEFMSVSDYCNSEIKWKTTFRPDVVVLNYLKPSDVFTIDVSLCKTYLESEGSEPLIVKKTALSDTRIDNSINMKTFISFWKQASNERNYTILLQGAFDTYSWSSENKINMFKNGWWYLEKDPGTKNASEFVFQEKINVAARVDLEENVNNLPWYLNKTLSKNSHGIRFHDYSAQFVNCTDFQQILYVELNDIARFKNNFVQRLAACNETYQVFILMSDPFRKDFDHLSKLNNIEVTLLIPLNRYVLPLGFRTDVPGIIKNSGLKYGYYIHMEYCGLYSNYDNGTKNLIDNALADSKSTINIFHFEEYEDTVNLGATRMFRLRITLFENCRKLALKNRNTLVSVGFALRGYYKGSYFYKSQWAMKNYVKYMDLMSSWAENLNGTVVFLGADEDQRLNGDFGRKYETVGWYSYNEFVEKKGYKPKKEWSLNVSTLQNQDSKITKYFGLTKNQFILVICSILAVFSFIVVVVIYSICQFRKKNYMTREECKEFFNGRSAEELHTNDPNYIKYDQVTYEVSENDFKVITTDLLGSGEFGIVCRGTITICDMEIQVAVKTSNPQKLHKTLLNGLLSEIKVLSYVGRHPNIIRLLGANTSSLKTGKVFVFLELCELGSLKNFLIKLRATDCHNSAKLSACELKPSDQAVNKTLDFKPNADASLLNEFYQWSQKISNGMEYLVKKHVVHADLSTRNILLNSRREVKICDFGLSRRMYNYENYVKTKQEPMPWRWMAPESLRDMVYNEKTDIWAYGVTLWEIYSLGSLPYPGLTWDNSFIRLLEDGLVPCQPDIEDKTMYGLMKNCWKILPDERPTFSQISSTLSYSEIL